MDSNQKDSENNSVQCNPSSMGESGTPFPSYHLQKELKYVTTWTKVVLQPEVNSLEFYIACDYDGLSGRNNIVNSFDSWEQLQEYHLITHSKRFHGEDPHLIQSKIMHSTVGYNVRAGTPFFGVKAKLEFSYDLHDADYCYSHQFKDVMDITCNNKTRPCTVNTSFKQSSTANDVTVMYEVQFVLDPEFSKDALYSPNCIGSSHTESESTTVRGRQRREDFYKMMATSVEINQKVIIVKSTVTMPRSQLGLAVGEQKKRSGDTVFLFDVSS